MNKRLVIDARWLRTGIGRYVMNLLEGIQHRKHFAVHALVRKQDASTLRPLCDDITVVDLPIYGWREQVSIPWAARGSALLHVPHYNVPVCFRRPFLVTVHDLIHLTNSMGYRPVAARTYARALLRFATRKAWHIVTVSNFSKAELIRQLGVPEEKITVIYNGVHPRFCALDREKARQQVRIELSLNLPYFLYVGNLKPHKNVELLLWGFSQLRARGVDGYDLVIVGEGASQRKSLQMLCALLDISAHVRFIPRIEEEMLPSVYSAAELFVMPSLMEGFGYPVVEAMACGTPVICSRASALPEIAREAAEFFEPTSCEDLVRATERVLGSPEHRELLRQKGIERAKAFNWEECARQHSNLYREIMQV